DRTNPSRRKRELYLRKAKQAGYSTKIVWVNLDRQSATERAKARKGHSLKAEDIEPAVQYYFRHFRQPAPAEADSVEVIGGPPEYAAVADIRKELGDRRYLIVGDP